MTYTTEQIEKAFSLAPESVKFYIEEGLLADQLGEIARKNALPISLAMPFAKIGEAALLGLIPPAVFTEELVAIGVPPVAVKNISASFFEDVVKKAIATKIPEPFEEAPVSSQDMEPAQEHDGIEQRMLPEGHHSEHPEAVLAKPPTTSPQIKLPTAPSPRPTPPQPFQPKPRPIPPTPPQEPVRPRTMASDVEAMQGDGKKPHAPAPVPKAPPPPVMPQPVPSAQPPVPSQAKVHEDLKNYGVDPYREPIE